MKELLQRIAANSHKVPGLKVEGFSRQGDCFDISVYGELKGWIVLHDEPRVARHNLLSIVDAIEAAGLARFSRESFLLSDGPAWEWNAHPNASKRVVTDKWFVSSENKQEHIALAECLASVMEALPEVQK